MRLSDLISAELDEGRIFLDEKGHSGAVLTVCQPDGLGLRTLELGGRFAARPDASAHAVVEIDPGQVGWRLAAYLSIWPDADEASNTIDLGGIRTADPSHAEEEGRVLARRAYVSLWEYLEGRR
jgi:hypothetical protein